MDGGAKAFRQKWGYDIAAPLGLLEEVDEEDNDDEDEDANENTSISESASLREDIISSAGYSPLGKCKYTNIIRARYVDMLLKILRTCGRILHVS